MPKKKFRDTPEKQSARFLTTARQLGFDESGKAFERAMRAVAPEKPRPKAKARSKPP